MFCNLLRNENQNICLFFSCSVLSDITPIISSVLLNSFLVLSLTTHYKRLPTAFALDLIFLSERVVVHTDPLGMTKLRLRAPMFSNAAVIGEPANTEYFKAKDIKIGYKFL